MSGSQWPTAESFGAAADAFREMLYDSAASALRDRSATFPFSRIADRGVRQRLASELMLSGGVVEPGWMVMFRTAAGVTLNAAFLESTGRLAQWSVEPSLRLDHEDESIPRCIARFMATGKPTWQANRRRALGSFPFAIQLAILEAHAAGPRSRVQAAWAVLDAIDAGRRLLPVLCAFLRVGKGTVRASRVLAGDPWSIPACWSKARCLMRVVAAMPPEVRPSARIVVGSVSARELRVLSVIVGRAGLAWLYPPPLMLATTRMLPELLELPKRQAMACLRRHRRVVRRVGVAEWLSRTCDAGTLVRMRVVRAVTTSSGWRACPLQSKTELVIEGSEMENCVASLVGDVRTRAIVVLSLQSSAFDERLTMVVADANRAKARGWMAIDRENGDEPAFESGKLCVRLVGPGNSPPSYAGVRGAMDVLEILWPNKGVIRISAS